MLAANPSYYTKRMYIKALHKNAIVVLQNKWEIKRKRKRKKKREGEGRRKGGEPHSANFKNAEPICTAVLILSQLDYLHLRSLFVVLLCCMVAGHRSCCNTLWLWKPAIPQRYQHQGASGISLQALLYPPVEWGSLWKALVFSLLQTVSKSMPTSGYLSELFFQVIL